MSKKRFFWLSITLVWLLVSIVFANMNNKSLDSAKGSIVINNSKKVASKVFYAPLRLTDTRSFVHIYSKNNVCRDYVEQGVINLKYEYRGKVYAVSKHGSFDLDAKFKYGDSIKVTLEAKKDIQKCEFFITPYPGKYTILLTGILFYLLPAFLVYFNILLPIVRYFFRGIRK